MALDDNSLAGRLLIAMPATGGAHFERSVVYLCAHNEDGAMGIIVNKPVPELRFIDLMKQLFSPDDDTFKIISEQVRLREERRKDLRSTLRDSLREQFGPAKDPFRRDRYNPPKTPSLPQKKMDLSKLPDIRVHFGGPVEGGRGFVLHSADYESEGGTMRIDEEISMTATLDILRQIAAGEGPKQSMLALGYAGWGPGQLEAEIRQNAWLTGPARSTILFGRANEFKWNEALKAINVDPQTLSSSAGNA